jgi:hypothetical protein
MRNAGAGSLEENDALGKVETETGRVNDISAPANAGTTRVSWNMNSWRRLNPG